MESHASHEACELKYIFSCISNQFAGHASHEACELKLVIEDLKAVISAVTPRMRRVS